MNDLFIPVACRENQNCILPVLRITGNGTAHLRDDFEDMISSNCVAAVFKTASNAEPVCGVTVVAKTVRRGRNPSTLNFFSGFRQLAICSEFAVIPQGLQDAKLSPMC
jgi:hypothetical protein